MSWMDARQGPSIMERRAQTLFWRMLQMLSDRLLPRVAARNFHCWRLALLYRADFIALVLVNPRPVSCTICAPDGREVVHSLCS